MIGATGEFATRFVFRPLGIQQCPTNLWTMSTIRPHQPPTQCQGLGNLSPLKRIPNASPESVPTEAKIEDLSDIRASAAPKQSSRWTSKTAFAALGLTLVAGGAIVGGMTGPMLSGAQAKGVSQVQVQTARPNSPTTLLQEQTQGFELQTARFGVTPTVRSFGDAPVGLHNDQRVEGKYSPDGQNLEHEISIDRLNHKDGRALYSSDEAELGTLDFHDEAEGSWMTDSKLQPAGHAGKYVSVSETTVTFKGGASASTDIRLRTIDTETAQVVNLSELLSPEQYQKVAASVQSGLNSLQGLPYQTEDAETLDSHMNNGFALNQDKQGKTTLTVVIPASTDSGTVAEFVFSIPANALQ